MINVPYCSLRGQVQIVVHYYFGTNFFFGVAELHHSTATIFLLVSSALFRRFSNLSAGHISKCNALHSSSRSSFLSREEVERRPALPTLRDYADLVDHRVSYCLAAILRSTSRLPSRVPELPRGSTNRLVRQPRESKLAA